MKLNTIKSLSMRIRSTISMLQHLQQQHLPQNEYTKLSKIRMQTVEQCWRMIELIKQHPFELVNSFFGNKNKGNKNFNDFFWVFLLKERLLYGRIGGNMGVVSQKEEHVPCTCKSIVGYFESTPEISIWLYLASFILI